MLFQATAASLLLIATLAGQSQSHQTPTGWSCVAGRAVDPAYVQLAERTGGQLFLFDRSEAGRSLVLMREERKHEELVFRATGTLAAGYHDYQFPVDSTVESLLLAISLQCSQAVSIYRPSGAELRASEPGVEDNVYRSGRIVIQSRPEAGMWRVQLVGAGIFSIVVQASSPISFHDAEFVELGGRSGHEGYFALKSPARLNTTQLLSARLYAPPEATEFFLVNSAGEVLQRLDLQPSSARGDDREFMGAVTPSHATFRVVVEGRDASGFWYQRLYPYLFELKP